jgi:hypothetical protein
MLLGLALWVAGGILIRSAFLTPPDPRLVFNKIFLRQDYPGRRTVTQALTTGSGGSFTPSPNLPGSPGGSGGGGGGGAW